ncbi:EAL domain-containing protein [Rhodoferax sp. GW822-FHT02A01]|uniref:EAL domain-containing protein n=1 Tax=Rhodoferax sp. GW822-FHT02A01 TaxID=3141537 RepID=UPI00315D3E30
MPLFLVSSYDPQLVALSLLVAVFASYVALDLSRRVAQHSGKGAIVWLTGGSLVMGSGIWAMHFVGMMAFSLPIPLGYDWSITLVSWIAAITVSGVALYIASTKALNSRQLFVGGTIMGLGISLMHYVGMYAMQMDPAIVWNPWLVVLSIAIAIGASFVALRIFFWMRSHQQERVLQWQILSSIVMGLAIFTMHFTGMAAAQFPLGSICRSANGYGTGGFGYVVGAVAFGFLVTTLITSLLDARFDNQMRILATAFNVQECILVTDADGKILRVNEEFTKVTGFMEEEVIGQNPRILNSGRHDAAFFAAMWSKVHTTGSWTGEIWNCRKNGQAFLERLTITAVKDSNGRIVNYVSNSVDITKNKAAEEEIQRLAFYDSLTNLSNRRLLIDRLQQALASSARNGHTGALLFIDLDNFKDLNDSQGHEMGDLLLRQVAARISGGVRACDTVSRFGGDEFVVLLEDLSADAVEAASEAGRIGQKILDGLSISYDLGDASHHSTASMGIALFSNLDQGVEELLKQADIAMYQAKKAGRNRLRFFDRKMQESISARVSLEGELRQALLKNQFQLFYQIQVNSEGCALGAEALIRWVHPQKGLVPPAQFIPIAEESGLILPIGQWVLDMACVQLKAWEKIELTQGLALAINVSAKQFQQADFVDQVVQAMQRHGINPQRLKLELTESMLLEDINDTISKMKTLNKLGVMFSLDDFGTGYSSLQYLKRLPLEQLKIDQSFVRDIVSDVQDRAIVHTIIAMASSLDMGVIAEGVETIDHQRMLLDKGCVNFQGYLFGKPLPIDEFEALLWAVEDLTANSIDVSSV